MTSKCTIIIPTYNRPIYLKRILSYYDEYGKDFNIIVADSSSDENKKINKKIILSLPNLNILYKTYPVNVRPYYYFKIADSINQVKTEYCVICADDDFVTSSGTNLAIEFLERNPDFVCCQGNYISFYLKTNKNGQLQFYWKPRPVYKSVISSDPKTRLIHRFSDYYQTIWAVHRTDFSNMIWKETMKFTDDARFGELLPSMLTLIYGKMKRLEVLYGAREILPDSDSKTYKKFRDIINEATYAKKYFMFKDCLATHLSKNSQISIEEAKELIDKSMSEYITKNYREFSINKEFLIQKFIQKIDCISNKIPLPSRFYEYTRKVYGKTFRRTLWTTDDSPKEYLDEFNKIKKACNIMLKTI